jgi:hypothetical protein
MNIVENTTDISFRHFGRKGREKGKEGKGNERLKRENVRIKLSSHERTECRPMSPAYSQIQLDLSGSRTCGLLRMT